MLNFIIVPKSHAPFCVEIHWPNQFFLLKKFVGEQQAVDTQDFLLNTCQADK